MTGVNEPSPAHRVSELAMADRLVNATKEVSEVKGKAQLVFDQTSEQLGVLTKQINDLQGSLKGAGLGRKEKARFKKLLSSAKDRQSALQAQQSSASKQLDIKAKQIDAKAAKASKQIGESIGKRAGAITLLGKVITTSSLWASASKADKKLGDAGTILEGIEDGKLELVESASAQVRALADTVDFSAQLTLKYDTVLEARRNRKQAKHLQKDIQKTLKDDAKHLSPKAKEALKALDAALTVKIPQLEQQQKDAESAVEKLIKGEQQEPSSIAVDFKSGENDRADSNLRATTWGIKQTRAYTHKAEKAVVTVGQQREILDVNQSRFKAIAEQANSVKSQKAEATTDKSGIVGGAALLKKRISGIIKKEEVKAAEEPAWQDSAIEHLGAHLVGLRASVAKIDRQLERLEGEAPEGTDPFIKEQVSSALKELKASLEGAIESTQIEVYNSSQDPLPKEANEERAAFRKDTADSIEVLERAVTKAFDNASRVPSRKSVTLAKAPIDPKKPQFLDESGKLPIERRREFEQLGQVRSHLVDVARIQAKLDQHQDLDSDHAKFIEAALASTRENLQSKENALQAVLGGGNTEVNDKAGAYLDAGKEGIDRLERLLDQAIALPKARASASASRSSTSSPRSSKRVSGESAQALTLPTLETDPSSPAPPAHLLDAISLLVETETALRRVDTLEANLASTKVGPKHKDSLRKAVLKKVLEQTIKQESLRDRREKLKGQLASGGVPDDFHEMQGEARRVERALRSLEPLVEHHIHHKVPKGEQRNLRDKRANEEADVNAIAAAIGVHLDGLHRATEALRVYDSDSNAQVQQLVKDGMSGEAKPLKLLLSNLDLKKRQGQRLAEEGSVRALNELFDSPVADQVGSDDPLAHGIAELTVANNQTFEDLAGKIDSLMGDLQELNPSAGVDKKEETLSEVLNNFPTTARAAAQVSYALTGAKHEGKTFSELISNQSDRAIIGNISNQLQELEKLSDQMSQLVMLSRQDGKPDESVLSRMSDPDDELGKLYSRILTLTGKITGLDNEHKRIFASVFQTPNGRDWLKGASAEFEKHDQLNRVFEGKPASFERQLDSDVGVVFKFAVQTQGPLREVSAKRGFSPESIAAAQKLLSQADSSQQAALEDLNPQERLQQSAGLSDSEIAKIKKLAEDPKWIKKLQKSGATKEKIYAQMKEEVTSSWKGVKLKSLVDAKARKRFEGAGSLSMTEEGSKAFGDFVDETFLRKFYETFQDKIDEVAEAAIKKDNERVEKLKKDARELDPSITKPELEKRYEALSASDLALNHRGGLVPSDSELGRLDANGQLGEAFKLLLKVGLEKAIKSRTTSA